MQKEVGNVNDVGDRGDEEKQMWLTACHLCRPFAPIFNQDPFTFPSLPSVACSRMVAAFLADWLKFWLLGLFFMLKKTRMGAHL